MNRWIGVKFFIILKIMGMIKLNFLDDDLSVSRISVDVDDSDIEELFEYWEDNLEEVDDSEFEVYFEN